VEPLIPVAGPPVFLVPPGDVPAVPPGGLTASVITLSGPEGHHAAAVRRLRPGERADVSDGAGTLAEGTVLAVTKESVTIEVRAVYTVSPPQPRLVVAQALPKGDRGELAVELMTEMGVDAIIPWAAERNITKWQAERGEKALARWRTTAREAAKQSRRPWLPEVTEQATTAALANRVAAETRLAIVLEADAPAKLHELPLPETGDILLIVGPEGGISPAERETLRDAGATEARLGPTVLRTSTAGAAAAAVLLSRTPRW
jgi:16S rRNA (uracil1498-N3)-methyltransferase